MITVLLRAGNRLGLRPCRYPPTRATPFSRAAASASTPTEPVGDELVELLLRAAMAAPSAGNQQPWQFVVVRDRETLLAVTVAHPYARMLTTAPLAVLVCGDTDLEKWPEFWEQDCAAATENLLIEAERIGLGAVWLGVHPRPERVDALRALFALPAHIVPFALVRARPPRRAQAAVGPLRPGARAPGALVGPGRPKARRCERRRRLLARTRATALRLCPLRYGVARRSLYERPRPAPASAAAPAWSRGERPHGADRGPTRER